MSRDISEEDYENTSKEEEGIVDPYPTELTYISMIKLISTHGEKALAIVHFVARFANAILRCTTSVTRVRAEKLRAGALWSARSCI